LKIGSTLICVGFSIFAKKNYLDMQENFFDRLL